MLQEYHSAEQNMVANVDIQPPAYESPAIIETPSERLLAILLQPLPVSQPHEDPTKNAPEIGEFLIRYKLAFSMHAQHTYYHLFKCVYRLFDLHL